MARVLWGREVSLLSVVNIEDIVFFEDERFSSKMRDRGFFRVQRTKENNIRNRKTEDPTSSFFRFEQRRTS